MNDLRERLNGGAAPHDLEACLDGLDHAERLRQVRALRPGELRRLYQACAGRPVDLEHFVPRETAEGVAVRHYGVNSLPLFRRFEKRFMRRPGSFAAGAPRLWGYNHQTLHWLTGPGYFVVEPARDGAEIAIDYYQVPEEQPGAGWPPLRGNEGFPARLVYGFMKDFMRRVSRHVSVGRAHKKGRPANAYFALVREA